jgi:hypothetical protein
MSSVSSPSTSQSPLSSSFSETSFMSYTESEAESGMSAPTLRFFYTLTKTGVVLAAVTVSTVLVATVSMALAIVLHVGPGL